MAAGDTMVTRDVQALRRFEAFLFSAIATVLVVRALLAALGYPQVGGGGLHIAHVLWGGLLMGVAIVVVETVPGNRWRVRAAYIGGVGFGLFIDEVGKFVTKDVNYFFRPAIAIIYAVFVGMYLVVRELLLRRPPTETHRLAVAASALGDLALGQLDSTARTYALRMLDGVTEHAVLRDSIRAGLRSAAPPQPLRGEAHVTALRDRIARGAAWLVHRRGYAWGLLAVFVLQAVVVVGELYEIVAKPEIGRTAHSDTADVVVIAATAVSLAYLAFGVWRLIRGNALGATRVLYRSVLVTVMFTQVFVFAQYQWSGLVGFGLELLVLYGLHVTTAQQRIAALAGEPLPIRPMLRAAQG